MVQALNTQMLGSFSTKKITPKTKGNVKGPSVKKAAPKKPAPKKAAAPKKVAKATVKKAKPAPKPAPPPIVRPKPRRSGGTSGWFGDAGGVSDLGKWYGSTRQLFLPKGLLDLSEVAPYLNGTLPGDYGYDPLGIGTSVEEVNRFRGYELIHGRWAMLGAAGMIIPEGLAANGADIKGAAWYETGAAMLPAIGGGDGLLNYFAVPWAVINNPLPLIAVLGVEVVLMYLVETYRATGEGPEGYAPGVGFYKESAFAGLDPLYPGGPLDPFGLAADPEVFQELKVKEIKNGRLAMMATLGFAFQAVVTGEGPYANWTKHIADPFGYNLITVLAGEDRAPTL